jgi:hypothetical protein
VRISAIAWRWRAALAGASVLAGLSAPAPAQDDPRARAEATEAQMTDDERITLTLGHLTSAMPGRPAPPPEARPGAGYIPGIARLGVPALYETDGSLGVTWIGGARGSGGTQLPSGTAQGATFDPELIERGGRMAGAEARAKGFNVMLAGGINLMRDPRNGRTFEYLSEDPLLAGLLGGAAVRGIQSNNVISTLKHYAINPQETGRAFMNTVISKDALRESDLLAFEIAIEQGDPGSVMCAYNATNGAQSCGNHFLLTEGVARELGLPRLRDERLGRGRWRRVRARRSRPAVGRGDRPAAVFRCPAKGARGARQGLRQPAWRDGPAGAVGDLRQRPRQAPCRHGELRRGGPFRSRARGCARGDRAADERGRNPSART